VVHAWEQRLATAHLAQDASNRPQIHRRRVALRQKHDFWCSIPAGDHVLRERGLRYGSCFVLRLWHVTTRKTEVTDFDLAVLAQENVARLQIAMRHTCGMQVGQAPQDLAGHRLHMSFGELLARFDNLVQVCVHVGEHQEQIPEVYREHGWEVDEMCQILMPQPRQ
jgi:hypothetical protein